jgi:hypothetical protein
LLLVLLAGWGLTACAPTPVPAPSPVPPEREVVQPLALRVLDFRDRPLAGVEVAITPRAGRPQNPGPYLTDAQGILDLPWLAQAKDELAHLRGSPDRLITYHSSLSYAIEAPGCLPARGSMATSGRARSLRSPELASMETDLALGSLTETVVLRRPLDLMGRGLKGRPADDPLVARCLAFRQMNQALASRLGAEFAWPSFALAKQTLALTFDWRGITWGGLKQAPLAAQVAVNAGVPLAMAAGMDLLPAPGVEVLVIQFASELPSEGDLSGPPRRARVVLQAPADKVQALAAGGMRPDDFLQEFPPRLEVDPVPGQ